MEWVILELTIDFFKTNLNFLPKKSPDKYTKW